jgi:PHD/YefM family antitoxin component YafN of YafNO toxin-antitoxin module
MIEITSTELRKNIGKYLDLAIQKKEQLLVRHRNKGLFTITPAVEPENVTRNANKTELEAYLDQPEVRQSIRRGIADVKAGRVREVNTVKDLWEGIQ